MILADVLVRLICFGCVAERLLVNFVQHREQAAADLG